MRFCWLYLVSLLMGSLLVFGQTSDPSTKGSSGVLVRSITTAAVPNTPSTEEAVLRAQLAEIRANDERLLDTVHWSLGVAVTIAILLIGYGWYVNSRVYERERDAMTVTLQSSIRKQLTQAVRRMNKKHVELGSGLRSDVESLAKATKKHVEHRLEHIDQEFGGVGFKLASLEKHRWEEKNVGGNVLSASIEMFQHAIRSTGDFEIGASLDSILACLKAGNVPSGHNRYQFELLWENVPDKHKSHPVKAEMDNAPRFAQI